MKNFENHDSGGDILKLLMAFEEILEEYGIIDSDFAFIVAKPKKNIFSKR